MNRIIELAIDRHGGADLWNGVESIEVDLRMSGALLEVKGFPDALVTSLRIDPRKPAARLSPYSVPGQTGFFTPNRVWIEGPDGTIKEERASPRSSFEGHVWATQWDDLQRLYFAGYAMWDYLTIPFLFAHPGFEFKDLGAHVEDGEEWASVKVYFPDDIPAHCKEQTFYFDAEGLLKRIDYQTDIAGGVASHYCYDPKVFNGLVIPTRRRVVQRTPTGPRISGRTGVFMEYTDVRVIMKGAV